ncbi:PQQ-dependent membrane bound dehydrogenase, glucose/quinate/shikimate-related [Trema orientale]|uniref:PQQ-dependent membrane bound dehydrogenase, glucose/quinate/shikimate-related n=1 Tax=Trema orientale TaxID=63057 RepID=A0A2P5FQB7_TREOI|nr:PQQ-dependent membrane bound dehydrogenase, glucose/quinate/shikimate-related [Trema orientale]
MQWLNHGNDITNNRNANGELVINPITASQRLRLRWKFFAGKDITATPAVAAGVVYFPSWNGYLYAVNALNGGLVWKRSLNELTGLNGTGIVVNVTVSRTTPAISGDLLIVGIYGPALVIAVSRFDGSLVWSTLLDPSPRSQITASGTVYSWGFYVGVSSLEVALPAEQCCTFRGSMVKLDARNGAVLWRTYTIPDNGGKRGGYAGAAIWGSSPAIDVRRRHVYVGTGQLYTAPQEVLQCQEEQNKQPGKPTHPDQCIGPDVHFNSILAFDIDSGRIVWSRQLGGYDVFYFVCLVPNNPDCPPGPNLDADFGEAPMLLTVYPNGTRRDVAVAVQKSGFAWALDRDNGDIVWFKLAGPGSLEGGGIWGAATDGKRVYTNIANADRKPFVLAPSNRTANSGGWVALDANSGRIVWTTADPSNDAAHGPVTVVNGVVFAGSVAPNGPIYAMDANTGRILWSFNTNATVYGGVSASYGCIYTGHGYTVSLAKFHPTWTPGTSLFAFCVL